MPVTPITPVLAVHGGSGDFGMADLTEERASAMRRGLRASLDAGMAVLIDGASALDAVEAAVVVLEDDESFNAGRGAVLTAAETIELDAAVADGWSRRAAGVAAAAGVRNPVTVARAVLEHTPHVLLVGPAVAALAESLGLATEPPEWFVTDLRRRQLHQQLSGKGAPTAAFGTVGAVALDADGHLAAATSTGGTTAQRPVRVGDSPVVGAGTWADDATCAVSATGHGEAFLMTAFGHEVDAQRRLAGLDLDQACAAALAMAEQRGGTGGCIAVGPDGSVAMPFTARGMFRASAVSGGEHTVLLGE